MIGVVLAQDDDRACRRPAGGRALRLDEATARPRSRETNGRRPERKRARLADVEGRLRSWRGAMAESVPVGGLFETHLTVSDLGRSVAFYRDVVGLSLALEVPDRGAAFFWIGGPGDAMLGLWSLGSAPMGLSLHVAFKASLEDVVDACDRLRSRGITPLSFFATETAEPSVIGWMPAAAVYFRDPDGHLLEYLAMLDEEPRPELGIVPWSQW
jgi:lactoylglutathione lyase